MGHIIRCTCALKEISVIHGLKTDHKIMTHWLPTVQFDKVPSVKSVSMLTFVFLFNVTTLLFQFRLHKLRLITWKSWSHDLDDSDFISEMLGLEEWVGSHSFPTLTQMLRDTHIPTHTNTVPVLNLDYHSNMPDLNPDPAAKRFVHRQTKELRTKNLKVMLVLPKYFLRTSTRTLVM